MVAAKTCKNGLYESIVYCDHCSCTFQCFKHNKICKHSLCVAEVSGILSQHLEYLRKTKCRSNPSRSELVEPTKQAQGKKGDCHKNPWRPPRGQLANENKVRSEHPCHPYSEIHHNNKPLIVCFLDDQLKAVECKQCRMEFLRRQKIVPYNMVLSHEEKWMYPDPTKPNTMNFHL